MKLNWRIAVPAGLATILVVAVAFRGSTSESEPVPMPLILQKVQAIGELHAARYTYQHVFEQSSSRKPEEWTRYMPGLSSLVKASTRNSALVSTTAEVEAGIDLSRATFRQEGLRRELVLPKPTIYRPQVDAQLHRVRPGVFWRDDNIALKAVSATQTRVREAAAQQGIVEEAERNVVKRLDGLFAGLGSEKIEIVFE